MSALSDVVANLESGGGSSAGAQPASMVNPTYGQYGAFVTQYGSGAAGVDNYASQFLQSNPNATLGDFYANYVQGTGSTSNPQYNTQTLAAQQPAAYNNLVNNAGYDPSTPLSTLVGAPSTTPGITVTQAPADANCSVFGSLFGSCTPVTSGGNPAVYAAQATQSVPTAITNAANSLSGTVASQVSTGLTAAENYLGRGFVMLLAIVLAGIAVWWMMGKPVPPIPVPV